MRSPRCGAVPSPSCACATPKSSANPPGLATRLGSSNGSPRGFAHDGIVYIAVDTQPAIMELADQQVQLAVAVEIADKRSGMAGALDVDGLARDVDLDRGQQAAWLLDLRRRGDKQGDCRQR